LRHAVVLGLIRVLHDDQAVCFDILKYPAFGPNRCRLELRRWRGHHGCWPPFEKNDRWARAPAFVLRAWRRRCVSMALRLAFGGITYTRLGSKGIVPLTCCTGNAPSAATTQPGGSHDRGKDGVGSGFGGTVFKKAAHSFGTTCVPCAPSSLEMIPLYRKALQETCKIF
jgi:hypothetical protein